MFSDLNVEYVDHFAVTTKNLHATLNDFMSLTGTKLVRGPGINQAQNVNYAFVQVGLFGVIEILSPIDGDSPINNHINNGGGAYHLCYAVRDLDSAINIATSKYNARIILEPRHDDAFDGRRVAFLFHPLHGMFELLESYHSKIKKISSEMGTKIDVEGSSYYDKVENSHFSVSKNIKLKKVFEVIFDKDITDVNILSMENMMEWDSFKHLLLMMEVEKEFDVKIETNIFSQLTSYGKIKKFLE